MSIFSQLHNKYDTAFKHFEKLKACKSLCISCGKGVLAYSKFHHDLKNCIQKSFCTNCGIVFSEPNKYIAVICDDYKLIPFSQLNDGDWFTQKGYLLDPLVKICNEFAFDGTRSPSGVLIPTEQYNSYGHLKVRVPCLENL